MKKLKMAGILRLLAMSAIVVIAWCGVRDRLRGENWGVPLDYRGDAPQILGWIQAASEGDYIPFWGETIHRLGAPYEANWNDYPMYEKILTFGLGMLSRWIGLFQTSNFAIVLAHVMSVISFYLCCRFLRYARLWSFVAAILFSLTYYHFFRNLGHLLLAYSYTVPWALLSCWLVASAKHMRLGDRLSWICLITALVMGLSSPYNLNIFMQLLCFSLLVQFLRGRRKENLKIGAMMIGVVAVAFIAINLGTLGYNWVHGKNPAGMDRHYFESELYALKPMEFFIPPPTHNVQALADIGDYYGAQVWVRGEIFSAYLGIIGIAGLIWVFADSFLLIVRNGKNRRCFPPYALQSVWIIFYSIIGGVNCILSLSGFQYFRGTDRYSIFISALILLFLVSRLSRLSQRWPVPVQYSVAAFALAFGIFDEVPRPLAPEETIANGKIVESDRDFCHKMEAKLKPGAMVFQMPVMSFPEAVPINEIQGYEMLRPYFYTKTLRFSFGSVRGRNREAWQWEVEKMPVHDMIAALEKYGFSAIYLNRKGYTDHGEALLKQFAAEGRTIITEDERNEQVCVALKPSDHPELPHTDDRAQILFRSGWSVKEHTPLENREWTTGNATFSFFSEAPQYASYSLKCTVGSVTSRHVTMLMHGKEIWSSQVGANQGIPVDIIVGATHGNNKIEIRTDEKPAHPRDSNVALAVGLINLQITKQP